MIVRILGDARYNVPDEAVGVLEASDTRLTAALENGDEASFTAALAELIDHVRAAGTILDPSDVRSSELVVPNEGSTLDEVQKILASEGGS